MSRKYKFWDNHGMYFISFATVHWIDVFTRNEYKDELIKCWQYCQEKKGLEIYAWCIMTSHVHMLTLLAQECKEVETLIHVTGAIL